MSIGHNGGPAFPCEQWSPSGHQIGPSMGMSLLDWFAGQALAGIMAFPGAVDGEHSKQPDVCARLAYFYAKAMLAAREAVE